MMNHKLIIGCIGLFLSASSSAQNAMTMRECMEYALSHSTKKVIQQADYSDALLQRRDAILQAFTPTVSAGTNTYTNFGRTIDPETNAYISMTSFSNNYFVNAGMTLFNGFTAINKMKMARTAVKMGLTAEQQLNDEICLSVMQAYCNVLFQTEMKKAMIAQTQTARENLILLQKQYELGQKGYADVVQVEADLAEREYQQITCENLCNEALLDLKAIMLWPLQDTLTLLTSVQDERLLPEVGEEEESNVLAAFAKNTQPKAIIARGDVEQARYALRAARGLFSPTLSVSGGWSTNYYTYPGKSDYSAPSFSTQFRNNGGEYVQLSLSIPLFNGLSRHSHLKRKKNELERATARYHQTLKDIESEVASALQDCRGAGQAYVQAQKRMRAQEEAYRLHKRKFEQGLISPVEYQTVANAFLNAKATSLEALLKYRLKRSVVRFYQGISYLEQQK